MDAALRQSFPPEFLGRLDRVVHFGALDAPSMEKIVQKYLGQIQKRTAVLDIQLQLPLEVAGFLGRKCRNQGGARALRRLVQEEVEGPLATFLLECSRRPSRICARMEDGHICFQ